MNQFFQRVVNYSLQQALIFGVVAGLAYYFFVFDDGGALRSAIENTQGEIRREEAKKKDTDATLKEEARMKETVGLLSRQYEEISRRLPSNLQSIELNRNVDAFARNSGVSIKARKPMPVVGHEIVDEVPIDVSLEGNYSELAQFAYLVASSERVTTLRNFVLMPVEPRSSRLKMEGTVVGYQLAAEPPPTLGKGKPSKKGAP